MSDFNKTLFSTVDPTVELAPGKSVPALTTMLLRVCDNDPVKFEEATRLVGLFITEATKDLPGWRPISTAKRGQSYLGAFLAPLQKNRWEVVGPGRVENGVFKNYLGDWTSIKTILHVPDVVVEDEE